MAKVAAHVTAHVLPYLPVRQWVLSLPKRLRPFLHGSPEVASAVLAVFLRALGTTLRKASPTCGGETRVIAFITDPPTVRTLLLHLQIPHRAPPVAPARDPPQAELLLDPSPALDLAAPDAAAQGIPNVDS